MNRKEFSERVGINENTLRKYELDFNIPIPRDPVSNYRIYGDEEVRIYLSLKEQLKTKSIIEIKQELGIRPKPEKPESIEQESIYDKLQPDTEQVQPDIINDINKIDDSVQDLHKAVSKIENTLQTQNNHFELLLTESQTMSKLTYKIGQLETQLKYEIENHEKTKADYAKEKNLIAEFSTKSQERLEQDISEKNQQLKDKDNKIAELEKQLEQEKNKNLFARIFKK